MSTDYRISGFIPPDEKWKKMKAIHEACTEAEVLVPTEVSEFFDWTTPDDNGVEVDLNLFTKKVHKEGMHGWELEISKIPKDVKIIRFGVYF